jgi:hypothetical protein
VAKAEASKSKLDAAGHYVDVGLTFTETAVLVAADVITLGHAVKQGKLFSKPIEKNSPKFVPPESRPQAVSPAKPAPELPADSAARPPAGPKTAPLKADAGLIHGVDQYRGGQTLLTAKVELPGGEVIKVAVPNEGGGWRPEQKAMAEKLGYQPLEASDPGSKMHAEGELEVFREKNKAKVLEWAISRGTEGNSIVCNEGCRNFTKNWGTQQQ